MSDEPQYDNSYSIRNELPIVVDSDRVILLDSKGRQLERAIGFNRNQFIKRDQRPRYQLSRSN